ncbi:MAG: hypothetical protein IPJ06_02500 [Saprospiraceae bacterium]|nr:hypothetical protein [Saprospiraceae bacterium]
MITADDGCDNTVDVTFVEDNMQGGDPTQCDYYAYSITRTWTATDDCGNETIHTQTITVQDVTAPSFTDPIDILAASQLGCGDENDLSLTGFPTLITDNCVSAEADGSAGYMTGDLMWITPTGTPFPSRIFRICPGRSVPFPGMVCIIGSTGYCGPGLWKTLAATPLH